MSEADAAPLTDEEEANWRGYWFASERVSPPSSMDVTGVRRLLATLDAERSRADETAWLIERGQPEGQTPTVWWAHPRREGFMYSDDWTPDAFAAFRFETREAADEVIASKFTPPASRGGPSARAVEHVFISDRASGSPTDAALAHTWAGHIGCDPDTCTVASLARRGTASGSPEPVLDRLVEAMPWKRWSITLVGDWESGWVATAHSRPAGEAGITVESHESVWGYDTIGAPTPQEALGLLRAALATHASPAALVPEEQRSVNEWVRGDWMQTFTGARFYPLDPRPAEIDRLDIAHALSLLCRYGGHVDRFYSVAEHCVLMSEAVAPEHALAALLHDATEAYVVDVPRPLKRQLPDYREIEDRVWWAVAVRFGLDLALPSEVTDADNRILITERTALMPRAERWVVDDQYEPLPVVIHGWSPGVAERAYAERLAALVPEGDQG